MRDPAGTAPERVLVVSASVGAGHDGAARELAHRLRARGVAVEIRDFLDALPTWLRFTLREGYTGTVNHTPWFYDWLYAALERPGLVQRIGLFVCWLAQRRILRWYADTGAHAVVSTYPLASQTLGQLVRKGRVAVPTTTFLTDPSVHTLWVNKHIGRHLTTMSATADIAERLYRAPMTVAGPLVPAQFQDALPAARRDQLIEDLGVDTARPLALVVTGSLGLGRVEETVDAIVSTDTATPVVLCGRNDRLRQQLAGRPGVVAVGWRNDVHDLMQLCDVMVHNAGGMSFSESLVAGLPAVTYKCIPGHGKANGDVLAESGVAPLADTLDELRTALELQLRPTARSATRASFAAAESDAAQVVLRDLRTRSLAAQLRATRTRARRVTIRRRVSAASAAAFVVLASFGATEGVSAATRHGYGVARMPARSVGLVVAPTALSPLGQHASELAAAKAAVLVPDHLTQQDSVAAERLAAEGIPLLAPGCSPATLIRHSTAQACGATRTLAADGVPTSRVVVSDGDVEALELVVARRDRTRIVIGEAPRTRQSSVSATGGPLKTSASGVWVMHQSRSQTAGDLLTSLREASRRVSAEGLVLRPVTDARTVK